MTTPEPASATSAPPSAPTRVASARLRILDAAVRCLVRDGVGGSSMAAIAAEAGVSKALLHYHYAHRERLLAEVAGQLGSRLTKRERAAMDGVTGSGTVDALWTWLDGELRRSELRALLELAMQREPEVRAAVDAAMVSRARAAAQTVDLLFASLGLTPRMPAALLGDASMAFMDGLAIAATRGRDARVSFDLFWLALLSLAE